MSKQPESHYNIDKLHFVFAIGALALLTVIGAVFMNDYDRKWKDYQNKFAQYKVEIARTKFDAEDKKLTNNAEYQNLVKEVEAARESYETTCLDTEELDTEINDLKTEKILTEQELRHTNAVRDAARFKYENAVGHHTEGIADLKTTYTELNTKAQELNLKAEEATVALNKKTETKLTCGAALKELQDKKRTIASKHTMMKKNLQATDPNEMTLLNRFAQVVRNLPILDLSTPTTKVKQIVLKDITEDLIIRQAPKVDRCMTCHLGIDNPDFADFPQPYRTHPNLDQYISNDSAHPIEEFGCTVCHGGKGRATGFQSAVHTPQNAEQQKDWEEKYNWKQDHHWEQPMLPLQHAQAGCFKCHSGENPIKGAETLNLGLKIIEKAGCYACHEIDRYKDWQNPGPDLTKISSKLSKEFAYKWIEDPHFFKKDTWMPAYFNLANNSDLVSQARSQQEIHAMVNYLFAESKDYKLNKMPKIFDAKNGEELVASLGCMACHNTEVLPESHETTTDSLRSQHGPSLTDLGTKTSKEWIYNWLKDPARYHAETRMPSLRLSDQEAADVAGYLVEDKHKTFVMKSIPGFDEDILNDIALGFMVKQQPKKQADRKLAKMTLDEKMYFSGEKLISQYGCYSCHNISGFENAKPIGVALNEEGSKSLHKFDFGYVHVDHTKHSWFDQKLKAPRSFDNSKVKAADEKLIMPNFKLTEHEREAVVTSILGFVSNVTVRGKMKPRTTENLRREKGEAIIAQLNCRSCHAIEGNGGTVQTTVTDWLTNFEGHSVKDAEKITESFSPPNLHGAGKKIDAKWLFNFLHSPEEQVRPWLKVRMPSYEFNVDHLNMLVQFFNTVDGEDQFPFHKEADVSLTSKEYKAAEKLFSQDYLGCTLCHVVGDQQPTGTKDTWAPDLGLANKRLKPEWIVEWIKDPSRLVPGTTMPTFFDPSDYENSGPEDIMDGDEDEQIRILRNYLMTLGNTTQNKKSDESMDEVESSTTSVPENITVEPEL